MNAFLAFLQAVSAANQALESGKLGTPAQQAQFQAVWKVDGPLVAQVQPIVASLASIPWNTSKVNATGTITTAQLAWLERFDNDLAGAVQALQKLQVDVVGLNNAY